MNELDIVQLIQRDKWMMSVLRTARSLRLPDWMIGAGFVRNKVWDYLHGNESKEEPLNDIDLIYFNKDNIDKEVDTLYAARISKMMDEEWEVVNQARMHEFHERKEMYKNSEEALSEWVETATCVAVRLEDDDTLSLFAPHGVDDLVNMVVRITPAQYGNKELLIRRVKTKKWLEKWNKLKVV